MRYTPHFTEGQMDTLDSRCPSSCTSVSPSIHPSVCLSIWLVTRFPECTENSTSSMVVSLGTHTSIVSFLTPFDFPPDWVIFCPLVDKMVCADTTFILYFCISVFDWWVLVTWAWVFCLHFLAQLVMVSFKVKPWHYSALWGQRLEEAVRISQYMRHLVLSTLALQTWTWTWKHLFNKK